MDVMGDFAKGGLVEFQTAPLADADQQHEKKGTRTSGRGSKPLLAPGLEPNRSAIGSRYGVGHRRMNFRA